MKHVVCHVVSVSLLDSTHHELDVLKHRHVGSLLDATRDELDVVSDADVDVHKVLPATCTCLSQAGASASNTFCHHNTGCRVFSLRIIT